MCLGQSFKKKIVAKFDDFAVLGVTTPHPSFIVECVFTNCCFTAVAAAARSTMRQFCLVVDQFWSALEAERSSKSRGFGLVCQQFCRCSGRGHWQCCYRPHKTTLYILWFHLRGSGLQLNCHLGSVLSFLDEVWLVQPSLWCCAVGHQECAVAFWVIPQWCWSKELWSPLGVQGGVGCTKFEIIWEVESARKSFVSVPSHTNRTWIWPVEVSRSLTGY